MTPAEAAAIERVLDAMQRAAYERAAIDVLTAAREAIVAKTASITASRAAAELYAYAPTSSATRAQLDHASRCEQAAARAMTAYEAASGAYEFALAVDLGGGFDGARLRVRDEGAWHVHSGRAWGRG